jgi:hypothetical protein
MPDLQSSLRGATTAGGAAFVCGASGGERGRAGSQCGDLGLEVGERLEGAVDGGEAQVGDDVELLERLEDRQAHLVGGTSGLPAARRVSSTREASRARASSSTGRPWQALRTPLTTLARLNGSVTRSA